ncbi:13163_t:CDS:1, partial [Gigaspora margarita]
IGYYALGNKTILKERKQILIPSFKDKIKHLNLLDKIYNEIQYKEIEKKILHEKDINTLIKNEKYNTKIESINYKIITFIKEKLQNLQKKRYDILKHNKNEF